MSLLKLDRTLMIAGDIDDAGEHPLSATLLLALQELTTKSKKPIVLYINSEGGSITTAFSLYDAIKGCSAPVVGIATGSCLSSALLVLQACSKRFATPTATLMIHGGSVSTGKLSPDECRTTAIACHRDMQRFSDLVRARTSIGARTFEKWSNRAKYFTPEEALKWGLIDGVIVGSKQ